MDTRTIELAVEGEITSIRAEGFGALFLVNLQHSRYSGLSYKSLGLVRVTLRRKHNHSTGVLSIMNVPNAQLKLNRKVLKAGK